MITMEEQTHPDSQIAKGLFDVQQERLGVGEKGWENRRGPTHSPRSFGNRVSEEEGWTITQKNPQAAKHWKYEK